MHKIQDAIRGLEGSGLFVTSFVFGVALTSAPIRLAFTGRGLAITAICALIISLFAYLPALLIVFSDARWAPGLLAAFGTVLSVAVCTGRVPVYLLPVGAEAGLVWWVIVLAIRARHGLTSVPEEDEEEDEEEDAAASDAAVSTNGEPAPILLRRPVLGALFLVLAPLIAGAFLSHLAAWVPIGVAALFGLLIALVSWLCLNDLPRRTPDTGSHTPPSHQLPGRTTSAGRGRPGHGYPPRYRQSPPGARSGQRSTDDYR